VSCAGCAIPATREFSSSPGTRVCAQVTACVNWRRQQLGLSASSALRCSSRMRVADDACSEGEAALATLGGEKAPGSQGRTPSSFETNPFQKIVDIGQVHQHSRDFEP